VCRLAYSFIFALQCLALSLQLSGHDQNEFPQKAEQLAVPLGLTPIPWPKDDPYSAKKAQLGRILYFDKRLSSDGTIACASCHQVQRAFTDNLPVAKGVHGRTGTRHAPTIINSAYNRTQFWDGRANSLEDQCKGPIANINEMSLNPDVEKTYRECELRLYKIEGYRKLFKEAFGHDKITIDDIAKALATFERTILSGNSPYDKYMAGDKTAMNTEQLQGYQVFKKYGCTNCHFGPNFTDGRFINVGIGMDAKNPDLGRFEVTHNQNDWGAFKIPTLREVKFTYPYMHNGSVKTLEDVIDYYGKGVIKNKNLNPLIHPLHLTNDEKKALVSFLEALSGEGWEHFAPPAEFPK